MQVVPETKNFFKFFFKKSVLTNSAPVLGGGLFAKTLIQVLLWRLLDVLRTLIAVYGRPDLLMHCFSMTAVWTYNDDFIVLLSLLLSHFSFSVYSQPLPRTSYTFDAGLRSLLYFPLSCFRNSDNIFAPTFVYSLSFLLSYPSRLCVAFHSLVPLFLKASFWFLTRRTEYKRFYDSCSYDFIIAQKNIRLSADFFPLNFPSAIILCAIFGLQKNGIL